MINPISPNTKPTAALMNAVWGEFDRKLTKILSGKSFLLARGQQFAPALMGKIFFFCADRTQTVYSPRAPGFITGTPGVDAMPIPYDHQVFVNALAAVEADIAANPSHATWDDTNRIVTVPVIPNSAYAFTDADYGSLPYEQWLDGAGTRAMGLCDHSLAAHSILHQGPKDASSAPYFVQEQGAVPEKRYKFALAEIVVEGLTALDIPDSYDKYNCFRIHNLSMEPLTVTFGSHYTVELEPYGCACVRRDSVTENYRQGFTYFFKFEKGDPRFAWFHATQQDPNQNLGGSQVGIIGGSSMMRVSNSMQANNLINPLCLHDWIGYMSVTEDWLALYVEQSFFYSSWGVYDWNGNDPRYAFFSRDPSVVADAYPANQKVFGDPSNPGTFLGDLLFHPGQIIVARTSRTDKDPATGNYQTTFSVINYRGMATMVEDFAAGGVTVYVESDTSLPTYGQLCFKNALSDICELIPISTNLFKYWDVNQGEEVHKPLVALHDQWNQNLPNHGQPAPSLDLAVFENPPSLRTSAPSGFMLASTAPASVFQRYLNVSDDSRSWWDLVWDERNGGFWNSIVRTLTVPGAIKFISVPNPTASRKSLVVTSGAPGWSCKPLHQVTVADLLDLSWWGNPQLSDQGTPYVTFSNKQLTLTDQGLVLSFDETISAYQPGGNNNGLAMSGDLTYWKLGQLTRTRVFQFRGHGWGHTGQGSKSMGFVSRRRGKQAVNTPYLNNEVSGPNGADFSLPRRSASQTQHRMLRRFEAERNGAAKPE